MSCTIAAVVVTYNRLDELKKNIDALQKQTLRLDKIFIIDNHSTDGTESYFADRADNTELVRLESNTGGAGGFSEGTKIAFQRGYDYVILMDDDGRPWFEDTIEKLMLVAKKHPHKKLMLNPLVCVDPETLSFGLNGIKSVRQIHNIVRNELYLNAINPFNGTFLSCELIEEIGYPNSEFFIKGDETDYTNRAKKANALIATVTSSIYYHPSMTHEKVRVLGIFSMVNDLEAPWKEYYRFRNYSYMYGIKVLYLLSRRAFKSFFIHDSNWKNRIEMMRHGYYDGRKSRLGKLVEPGQTKY